MQNKNGDTAFMIAAYNPNVEVSKFLYEKFKDQININLTNKNGDTAFMISAYNPNIGAITFYMKTSKIKSTSIHKI